MKMPNEFLKKYFLGLLDSVEAEQLELRILEDEEFEKDLIQAEQELIEDYLDNNLSNTEVIAFNQNFLKTGERKKRVEFVRYLRNYAGKTVTVVDEQPGFFVKIRAFFTPIRLALSFGGLLLLLGVGILIFHNSETDLAAFNNQDLSNLADFQNSKKLNLSPGKMRAVDKSFIISQQELTDKVMLRLALPVPLSSEQTFSVSILQNGRLLQTFSQHSYLNQEVRLVLPQNILIPGEYKVKLTNNAENYNYYFAVQ